MQALRRFTESYAYDDAGNLLSLVHTGWTRDFTYEEVSQLEPGKVSNRLTATTVGASTNSYAYDVHGNMLGLPHVSSMAWNFKDEFQQANLGGGGTAYYVYDSAGQRVRKVLESQLGVRRSERLYLGGFEVWREYQADGVTVEAARETLHVMDDKQRIALVETLTVDNGTAVTAPTPRLRYQLGNHLGSSSVELDEVAAFISYEEYHPYGTTALQAHNASTEVSLKRYRYTAKERDDETGLSYHGARYYAPWLARWTATDPSGTKDSLNLFQYVRSNPVGNVDLTGRETGAWDFVVKAVKREAGLVVGAVEGLGERVVSIAKMSVDPGGALVDMGAAAVANYKEGAKGSGGVLGGLNAAVNTFNPVYHLLVAAHEAERAEAAGDSFEGGRQSAKAGWAAVDTLMLATGGAKAATGAAKLSALPAELDATIGEGLQSAVKSLQKELTPASKPSAQPAASQAAPKLPANYGENWMETYGPGEIVPGPGVELEAGPAIPRKFTSTDPLVGELATLIDSKYPGHVLHVNIGIEGIGGLLTEFDIVLKNAIIQVKSGGGRGMQAQLEKSQPLTDLPVIGYGPELGSGLMNKVGKAGGLITRDLDTLLTVIAP